MSSDNEYPSLRGFDRPDGAVTAFIRKMGVAPEKVIAAVKSDLRTDGSYGDVWLFALDDRFVVADTGDGYFCCYKFSEWEIRLENYLTTGVLLAVGGGREVVAAAFTGSCGGAVGNICRIAERLRSGKELTDDDFNRGAEDRVCPKCGTPYQKGRKTCPKCQSKRRLFLRVLGYMPRYWKELSLVLGLILLSSAIGLLRPYLNGNTLYDQVLTEGGKYYGRIVPFVLMMILLEVTTLAVNIIQGRVGARVSSKIVYDIKSEVFDAMQRLSMSFFNSKHTGSLMNRVNSDALDIQYFLGDGAPQFIINAITIIGIGTVVFFTNPLLAVLIMLPVPLIVYIIKKVIPKFKHFKWIGWHKSSKLNSVINDTLQGIRVVKAFGKEKDEVGRFEEATQELYDVRVREGLMSARIFPLLNYLMTIGGLFIWGLGGNQVLKGEMTFGTLMTFVGYIGMLYAPINFMIRTYDWWANCMNSAQRIFEIVDRQTDVPEAKDPVDIGRIKGDVELRDVTFAYEPNKPVLKNVSFHVKPGEMIGLVGHSGAGKSTITNIITRLYDVNEGELLIDGVNIKKIRQKDLHGQIGMVLQDTFLFNGTIAENIAYARPDATMEEIVRAAKLANAHDFIMKLPDGYETEIGKRKTNLSGGERQRISIARTVLLDPAILILDEATASLDTETEQQIQAALETLTEGRTTIAIAHRLSTLKNADRLVVVERGEIAEIGTHEELANKPDGIYARMVGRQKDALRIRGVGDEEQL